MGEDQKVRTPKTAAAANTSEIARLKTVDMHIRLSARHYERTGSLTPGPFSTVKLSTDICRNGDWIREQ